MTIETAYVPISYAGNNVTNSFALTFDYQESSQIVANTEVVATGVITPLVYGTDFTITPTVNSPASFGTLTLLLGALPSGTNILITRVTDVTQDTSWINNSANPASAFENAVDKLTMIDQEILQGGGTLPDSALGSGTATTDTFLRGGSPRTWSNTLVGPLGAFTVPADTASLLNVGQSADAAMRLIGGASSVSAYRFAVDGDTNAWAMELVYDPGIPGVGFRAFGGSNFATFDNSGNVDFTGTVNANLYTGNADGSLITSGQVLPQFLASNASGNAAQFLNGLGQFAVPAGGGGINTTTTGTFTIAAVASSQTVPVTSVTGIVAGTELLIADGTHAIIGHVTVVSSLNLTFVTDSIQLGIAGDTMASGASVQASAFPGNNTIQVGDTAIPRASYTTIELVGQAADRPTGIATVDLYIDSISGSTVTLAGYGNTFFTIGALHAATSVHDLIAYKPLASAQWTTLGTSTQGAVLHADTTTTLALGKITASDSVTSGTITPVLLNATNSLTNGYVPSYDSGTGHFTWVANGGSIPGGGNAGQFLSGSVAFTNVLDLSASSGEAANHLLLGWGNSNGNFGTAFGVNNTGTQAFWLMQKKAAGVWGNPTGVLTNYVIGGGDQMTLSLQNTWAGIDSTPGVEQLYLPQMAHVGYGVRSAYGPLSKIFEHDAPASSTTIDLADGSYQRLTNFLNSVTITLADTTPVPTLMSNAYEIPLTLEISRIQSFTGADITWPGTITWVNGGSAPTVANGGLQATGFNIIQLVRVQNTGIANGGGARWFGYVENRQAGSGTVTSVATGTGLTGGPITTTGTIAVATGGITASLIANNTITSAQISATANIPTTALALPGGTTTFLAANGTWLVPPGTGGGGGGGPTLAGTQTWTGVNTYSNTGTFSGKQTFNGPQVFTSNGFGGTVGANAVAQITFNDYFPNDNVSPSLATAQKTTFTNSFNGGSTQEILALNILQTNKAAASGEGEGCMKVWNDIWKDITFGFGIGFQAITSARRVNGGNADGVWLNSFSPCAQFASTPDADGITHSFGSGSVRIGECNYGNSWADLGFIDDRGGGHYVAGLEFFPAWLAGTTGATSFTQFPASWAIAIGAANGGPLGGPATNWTGILLSENSIVPGGLGVNMHGGNISTTTTGTFTIAAVGASQTVAVTAATNMSGVAGFQSALQITDGTHTILGHVTAGPPGLSLTFVTDFIIAGTAGNTMGTAAIVTAGPGVGINLQSQFTTGINFAGSAGGAPIGSGGGSAATFTSTGAAAITLADDQSIKFGSIWLRGHSSTLQYSTNGTSWSTLTLP